VLSYGKLLAQGKAEEIRANPRVIEAYLGHAQENAGE
jgi:branched-chain amino acid transport system ATP-binding protein